MGRRHSGRAICETCQWIDVRQLRRDGHLSPGQTFPYSWTHDGQPCGMIRVRIEATTMVLNFKAASVDRADWRTVEQHVPIVWTACNLGGGRPWFRCTAYDNGHYCGRRVAIIYLGSNAGFACRHCHDLGYASQLETPGYRGLAKARKIRMRLGGSPNLLDAFPDKPVRMHRRTYRRLLEQYSVAAARCGAI